MAKNKPIDTLGEKIARRISGLNGLQQDVENERQDIGSDLRHIWTAFDDAKKNKTTVTVNGATNKKEWCAFAKITPRYAQYLVKDGSRKGQGTRTTVRFANLDKYDGVSINGKKFTVKIGLRNNQIVRLDLTPFVEEPVKPTAVTHSRNNGYSKRVSLCEKVFVNMPRIKGKVWAAKYEDATCLKCRGILDKKAAAPKPGGYPILYPGELKPSLQEKFRAQQAAKKERKVHAVDPRKKELTRCMKDTSKYPTAEGDAVTCGLCQSSRDASDRWEDWLKQHPEERGWHAYHDEFNWRNKLDGRRMEKTKRKKEYTVWDEQGVIGVADDYNKACALVREENPAAKALAAAVDGAGVPQVTLVVKPLTPVVEGARGTKLRLEAGNAAWGEKKVSKKVYERISAALGKYREYHWAQHPPVPERPENATVELEQFGNNSTGMIKSKSPEYEAWEAACTAAQLTPEYVAWSGEHSLLGELEMALSKRYDPLMEGDLDGDDECEGVAAD